MPRGYRKRRRPPIAAEITSYGTFMARVKRLREAGRWGRTFVSPIELHNTVQPRAYLVRVWLGTALVQEAMLAVDRAVELLAQAEAAHTPLNRLSETRAALRQVDLQCLIPTEICVQCQNSGRECTHCGGKGCI